MNQAVDAFDNSGAPLRLAAVPSGRATPRRSVSIVIPAYNEEDVLNELYSRLSRVCDSLPYRFEMIFINDGSKDRTLPMLLDLQKRDRRVAVVDLSRNFGKEIAMTAGLNHARGDAAIVIDADLQDPPELIQEMLERWEEGFDVVYASRESRSGETALKRATASMFYRVMRNFTRMDMPADTGDFRLLSRRAVDALMQLPEQHRFMKGLFAWIGFRQCAVYFKRDARFAGETKWNYWKLWNFAIEGFTSFTIAPLKVATYVGVLTAAAAFLYGAYLIVSTILFGNPVPGYPSLMVVMLFLGGTQLLAIGVVGEYLGRMFNESKRRPLYFVQQYVPSDLTSEPPPLRQSA